MKKPIIAAVLCFCLAFGATIARAQFGIGITVFDPSVYAEAIAEVSHLIQQYNQLVQTYQMITNQYNQMVWMAKTLPANLANFRAIRTPWLLSSATNTYGMTGGWITAINSGSNVLGGYQSATDPLQAYGAALGNVPADQLSRLERHYGTVELTDGATQDGIETIGTLRFNAPQVEAAIQNLEDVSLDSDPRIQHRNRRPQQNQCGRRNRAAQRSGHQQTSDRVGRATAHRGQAAARFGGRRR